MRVYEKITETITREEVCKIICNKCSREWEHADFTGNEFRYIPNTEEITTYMFALCDNCMHSMMDNLSIAPDESMY